MLKPPFANPNFDELCLRTTKKINIDFEFAYYRQGEAKIALDLSQSVKNVICHHKKERLSSVDSNVLQIQS